VESRSERDERLAREAYNLATTRISELARLYGFGFASFPFILTLSENKFAQHLVANYLLALLLVCACGVGTLILEYVQYNASKKAAELAIERLRKRKDDQPASEIKAGVFYNAKHTDIAHNAFFYKQMFSVFGAVLLVGVIAHGYYTHTVKAQGGGRETVMQVPYVPPAP
jgi:hypothetical protein